MALIPSVIKKHKLTKTKHGHSDANEFHPWFFFIGMLLLLTHQRSWPHAQVWAPGCCLTCAWNNQQHVSINLKAPIFDGHKMLLIPTHSLLWRFKVTQVKEGLLTRKSTRTFRWDARSWLSSKEFKRTNWDVIVSQTWHSHNFMLMNNIKLTRQLIKTHIQRTMGSS